MTGQYTYLKKIKVDSCNLQLGMYVCELDKKWSESRFLFQGFPLDSVEDLEAVQQECQWVYVDFKTREEYHTFLKSIANANYKNTRKIRQKNALSLELPRANSGFKRSNRLIKKIMTNLIKEEDFELEPVKEAVTACIESILHNQDALLLLSNIKNTDEYTAEHCLRVAIMAIAFAKFLGMDEDELHTIGIGAMLHDVGKMRVPLDILNKPGKLSPAEYCLMQDHAIEGFKLLKPKKKLSPESIEIALSHHERLNGKGYPHKLKEHQITRYTKIVTIVDTYDAITSERVYSSAKSPAVAFKVLLDEKTQQFDQELAHSFVEWIGIYPVGSIVEMQTGEIGIVTQVHPEQKLRPRVLLITDEKKQTGYEKIVDMGNMAVHSSGEAYKIKTMHANGAFGVDIDAHVKDGLILKR